MGGVSGSSGSSNTSNNSSITDTLGLKGLFGDIGQKAGNASGANNFLGSILSAANSTGGIGDSDPNAGQINNQWATNIGKAAAGAQSGPQFQQGGIARQGFAQGAAVEQARKDNLGMATDASNTVLGNNLLTAASGSALEPHQSRGTGSQSQMGGQAGISCCFIFLESLNGDLPWYVRKARDTKSNNYMVKGYRWMSRWLVPAMRVSKVSRTLVNGIMVKPLLIAGEHHYKVRKSLAGCLLRPVVTLWFALWMALGFTVGRQERGR